VFTNIAESQALHRVKSSSFGESGPSLALSLAIARTATEKTRSEKADVASEK